MKFGSNLEMNDECELVGSGHFLAILAIVGPTKLIFKLERECDGSNPYMKIGRNPKKND